MPLRFRDASRRFALAALLAAVAAPSRVRADDCDLHRARFETTVASLLVHARPSPDFPESGLLEVTGGLFDNSGTTPGIDLGEYVVVVSYPAKDGQEWLAGELRFDSRGGILPGNSPSFSIAHFDGRIRTQLWGPERCRLSDQPRAQTVLDWPLSEGSCGSWLAPLLGGCGGNREPGLPDFAPVRPSRQPVEIPSGSGQPPPGSTPLDLDGEAPLGQ